MDRVKVLVRNKAVVRAVLLVGVGLAGLTLPPEQIDQLADVLTMLVSLIN